MRIRYDMGRRHHNGVFVGWAIWKVHPGCMRSPQECCPKVVAEFYGPTAFKCAKAILQLLDLTSKLNKEKPREASLKLIHQFKLGH